MSPRRWLRAAVASGLLLAGACTGATGRGTILHPPPVPALAYPRVAVVSGHLEHEREAARLVAQQLGESDSRVWLLRVSDFEDGRQSPVPLGPGTALVVVTGEVRETMEAHGSGAPVGCAVGSVLLAFLSRGRTSADCSDTSFVGYHAESSGTLSMILWDGATGRITHRETVGSRREGTSEPETRLALGYELGRELVPLVSVQREQVEVELRPVAHPGARAALDAIEEGDWGRGRDLLLEAEGSADARRLDERQRADLLYDLAMAHRFAPTDRPLLALERARTALERARALRDEALYRRAIDDVDRQERVVRSAMAFDRARRRRFAERR